eukprot:344517-Chlamydomonas_euryale.AAC.12
MRSRPDVCDSITASSAVTADSGSCARRLPARSVVALAVDASPLATTNGRFEAGMSANSCSVPESFLGTGVRSEARYADPTCARIMYA